MSPHRVRAKQYFQDIVCALIPVLVNQSLATGAPTTSCQRPSCHQHQLGSLINVDVVRHTVARVFHLLQPPILAARGFAECEIPSANARLTRSNVADAGHDGSLKVQHIGVPKMGQITIHAQIVSVASGFLPATDRPRAISILVASDLPEVVPTNPLQADFVVAAKCLSHASLTD